MRSRSIRALLPAALVLLGFAGSNDLSYPQRQALDRQSRNQKEAETKLATLRANYAKETAQLEGKIIPPAFFKGYLTQADGVDTACNSIEADLGKNACPTDHASVRPLLDWVAESRAAVKELRADIAPKLAEAERIADPKNYPNLDADFERIEELGKSYGMTDFANHPEQVAELVKEFPNVTTWCHEKFALYRPLVVVTGGNDSPLYQRYERTGRAIKDFQTRAGEYYKQAAKDIPATLKDAVETAEKAARDKKPMFFTGAVDQKLEQAERMLKVCEALLPETDERRIGLQQSFADARGKIDALRDTLKDQIIAETRPPDEKYKGDDKGELKRRVLAEWQKVWPKDEVLDVRFHMENFDRTTKWSWSEAESAWNKVDHSVLAVTVIVKTSDRIATSYPAYVNVDHIDNTSNIGVKTKTDEYVHREMLLSNMK